MKEPDQQAHENSQQPVTEGLKLHTLMPLTSGLRPFSLVRWSADPMVR